MVLPGLQRNKRTEATILWREETVTQTEKPILLFTEGWLGFMNDGSSGHLSGQEVFFVLSFLGDMGRITLSDEVCVSVYFPIFMQVRFLE